MRKKQHKCINPENKEFDKYYIINYLEQGKKWKELKNEKDHRLFTNNNHHQRNDKNNNESKKYHADAVDDNDQSIEDWNDPVQTYFCLFCDDAFETEDEILNHMISQHKYDLKSIISQMKLSFYNQVKLINYIRRQVLTNTCFICQKKLDTKAEFLQHLHENDFQHIAEFPSADLWDQPEYFFSTFEDDSLLCLLDDSGYAVDEALKVKVIPEHYDIKLNDQELFNDLLLQSKSLTIADDDDDDADNDDDDDNEDDGDDDDDDEENKTKQNKTIK
jgi:hypothetical protein